MQGCTPLTVTVLLRLGRSTLHDCILSLPCRAESGSLGVTSEGIPMQWDRPGTARRVRFRGY